MEPIELKAESKSFSFYNRFKGLLKLLLTQPSKYIDPYKPNFRA